MIKKIVRGFLIFIAVILLIAAATVGPIDRTPLRDQDFYNTMMTRLDTTRLIENGSGQLQAGWTKVNITPNQSMPMAGYMPRDHFDAVHDSLYARILVIGNGSFRAAFINVDLLIFPPLLRDKLNGDGIFLYLSASHTHNGVGGWDSSIGGRLITGSFHEEWVDDTANKINSALQNIQLQNAALQYWETDATDLIENRVNVDSGQVDGKIRGVRVTKSDSSKAILFAFSAHATSIQKDIMELSADYAGKTIQELEKKNDFAMFMSGMVGSHRFKYTPENSYDFINMIGPVMAGRIDTARHYFATNTPQVHTARVPIEFGPSQLRIGKNWKVNDWAFRLLFRKLKGELTYIEIGNIVFIGTPCDFSGEIYTIEGLEIFAKLQGKHLIITSFNGDYDGYVTYDGHYEKSSKEEINALNWVGPYYGDYFTTMIQKLLAKK